MLVGNEHRTGHLARKLIARMAEKKLDLHELADRVDSGYENIRKVIRSKGFPSRHVLKEIAKVLDLDFQDLYSLMVSDQLSKKFGDIPARLSGRNAELAPIEELWPYLTDEQKTQLISIAHVMASTNSPQKRRPARVKA